MPLPRAYKIKYLGPQHGRQASLLFSSPTRVPHRPKIGVVPRDFEFTAEAQAARLARATPGFVMLAQLDPHQWVYIVENAPNVD